MKKQMKKITAMVLGLILFAGCMSPAQLTHAADGYSAIGIPYSKNMTISKNNYGYYIMSGKNLGYGEIMSIKSSNRKVIRPMDNADIYDAIWQDSFDTRKTGKAKLTITVKKKNGKTRKYISKVNVVKYKNPAKKIQLGSRNLTSKFNKDVYTYDKTNKKKEKISVQAKPGWKVKAINYSYRNKKGKYITTTVKNKDYIRYHKWGTISISMYKKSTKQTEKLMISMD